MSYDLHSHSNVSDGQLSPTELVQRAADKGVSFLALTDHDTIDGIAEAKKAAEDLQIEIIHGVELSVQWKDYNIHLVGLNIDVENELLLRGISKQQQARINRFKQITESLALDGIYDNEGQIQGFAGEHVPGRPHMARFLVENHHCESYPEAYKKLSHGGLYYSTPNWEYMSYAVNWITKAGGVAVLAHPDKYGMSKPGLRGFLREFKSAGGRAIEVCYGAGSKSAMSQAAHLAREYKLCGSVGSDFHRVGSPGIELGRINSLPKSVSPIWDLF
jgi:3',5'-nucleoside bisphosphate phosphatase